MSGPPSDNWSPFADSDLPSVTREDADALLDMGYQEFSGYTRLLYKFQVVHQKFRTSILEEVEEFTLLDQIAWKFTPGWRKRYKEIPLLQYISN